MNYQWVAVVVGKDGCRYLVSHKGLQTEKQIIATAEKFYGKKMDRVVEYR